MAANLSYNFWGELTKDIITLLFVVIAVESQLLLFLDLSCILTTHLDITT